MKIFCSNLAHSPWHLAPDFREGKPDFVSDPFPDTWGQRILQDGILPEHYFAERHIMNMVIKFIENLKFHGIYDNTRIIIVSDHDDADSQMIERAYNHGDILSDGYRVDGRTTKEVMNIDIKNYAPGRPHALLMFKDFNQYGRLRILSNFMSTGDVPVLAMKGIGEYDEFAFYDPEKLPSPRILTHAVGSAGMNDHNKNSYNCKFYQFDGTLFDPDKVRDIEISK